ncbi:hypothetical protein OQ279_15690 [Salinimicrobium sp. MT39]|uniref:Uncharacterized protein n=1 Tax=Salinimicrobium profundisediminis TaxID=2994553 RepID=A0A9X3D1J4_9FLAO|nr:hypothetical protein [Salinimicrobium profundisediminis]MCX2839589.1 hypothetical protein [Salinimicrobium profundisediminis]
MKTKRLTVILLAATFLLLLPLLRMQFSQEVNWDLFDFIVAAILLYGTGLIIELILRKVKDSQKRLIICAIILGVLFLVWAELAVGVFGSPFAGS